MSGYPIYRSLLEAAWAHNPGRPGLRGL